RRGRFGDGSWLAGLGVVGVAVGSAGLGMARGSAKSLISLSSNNANSGFPEGDCAGRGVDSSQCPFDREKRMKTGNALGYGGLIGGGVLLVGGAAMLAIYFVNKKKRGGAMEAPPSSVGTE